jgi:hypothetical protein
MFNHFDAHQFDSSIEDTPSSIIENSFEDDLQSIFEVSNIIERSGAYENANHPFEIPSIKCGTEEQTEIPEQIFPDEIELDNKMTFSHISDIDDVETNSLKEKIDQAVKNTLPTIEKQLMEQLYKEFNI